jgi:hypothetical protein
MHAQGFFETVVLLAAAVMEFPDACACRKLNPGVSVVESA